MIPPRIGASGSAYFRALLLAGTLPLIADADGTGTALVRHPPVLNGNAVVFGSIRVSEAEPMTLNGSVRISGDLELPGRPAIRIHGRPSLGGIIDGEGSVSPEDYTILLNGGVSLGHVLRRMDPVPMPVVAEPARPSGTRLVVISTQDTSVGPWPTVRDVIVNGSAGEVRVPPGSYGRFIVNAGSQLVLGVVGASESAHYSFEELVLNGSAQVQVSEPVVVTLRSGLMLNGALGESRHPQWLTLKVWEGRVQLNGASSLHGYVHAPRSQVVISGAAELCGGLACERLAINGRGMLRLADVPPVVAGENVSTDEDVPIALELQGRDWLGRSVAFCVVDGPQHGSLEGDGQYLIYRPSPDFFGQDGITFVAKNESGLTSAHARVEISVTPVADPATIAAEISSPAGYMTAGFPTPISVSASSVDGSIESVQVFDGERLLVEWTEAPFGGTWTPSHPGALRLRVRVFDSAGTCTEVDLGDWLVLPGLPYATGFEAGEGYVAGEVNGQLGWSAIGSAEIATGDRHSGDSALRLVGGEEIADAALIFSPEGQAAVVFVDFYARLQAGPQAGASAFYDGQEAMLAVIDTAPGRARFEWLEAGPEGSRLWRPVGAEFAVNQVGVSQAWHRITLRKDYGLGEWDVYVDGRLRYAAVPFTNPETRSLDRVNFVGPITGVTRVDDLRVDTENPLFADADHDGIDDAYESEHGLDPGRDDRADDGDGDRLSNLAEFLIGAAADRADTDGDGLADWDEHEFGTDPNSHDSDLDDIPDGWEALHGLDPRFAGDAGRDADGDGLTALQEFQTGSDPQDFFNGILPEIRSLMPDSGALEPGDTLSVFVADVAGHALANAPVTFSVELGNHRLAAQPGGQGASEVTVRTDSNGIARVAVIGEGTP